MHLKRKISDLLRHIFESTMVRPLLKWMCLGRCDRSRRVFYKGIRVFGCVDFQKYIIETLSVLESGDSYGYYLVKKYISDIIEISKPLNQGFIIGVAFFPGKNEWYKSWPHNRSAGFLVRNATRSRILNGFHIKKAMSDIRCLRIGLMQEAKTLRTLGCDAAYIKEIENCIANIDRLPSE